MKRYIKLPSLAESCAGCSRLMPTIKQCSFRRRSCWWYCRDCTRGMRARKVPGFPVDILTCTTCGERVAVHRSQRVPCKRCKDGPLEKWARGWRDRGRARALAAGFEIVARGDHHLMVNPRSRTFHDTIEWLRHQACGHIGPRWQRYKKDGKGNVAPPYCLHCGGEPWRSATVIDPAARDLLYLVEFQARGRRFLKIGRSLPNQDRLPEWIRLGARVVQVVEARHDKVRAAEKAIIRRCSTYRVDSHDFGGHFTTKETFRPGAQATIGDLTRWIGRGDRDRTDQWRKVAELRRRG